MIVEICANGFESAKAAQEGGANRIELCNNLSVGGLTPQVDTIIKVMSELDIPVHVLIRPRAGDFCYTVTEMNEMLKDIALCKDLGCAGIVSGVLTSEGYIDKDNTRRLLEASEGLEFTFHRAFDVSEGDALVDLKILQQLGVSRLLSSGKKHQAIDGLITLKQLLVLSEESIEIMPGSGIGLANAIAFKDAGFKMIHLSATANTSSKKLASFFETGFEGTSDSQIIKDIIKQLSK